jgi:hypothetical protein
MQSSLDAKAQRIGHPENEKDAVWKKILLNLLFYSSQ